MIDFLAEHVKPDQIVIADGGSKDDTIQVIEFYIKRGFPITLVQNPMPDSFAEQRNLALSYCTGDWILQIDADETYSKSIKELIEEIRAGQHNEYDGFIFGTAQLIIDENHMCDDGGDLHKRLFKNKPGIKFIGDIHERINLEGNFLQTLRVGLRHYSMLKNDEELKVKGKRYMQWQERSCSAGIPIHNENHFIEAIKRYNKVPYDVPKEWQ